MSTDATPAPNVADTALTGGVPASVAAGVPAAAPAAADPQAASGSPSPGAAASKAADSKEPVGTEASAVFDVSSLKMPEGFAKDDAVLSEFGKLAKDAGIKGEHAQKMFDLYANTVGAQQKKATESLAAEHARWVESLKSDKEVGGQTFDANVKLAQKAMHKYATPELRDFLSSTGLGNHPELVRLMVRVGKALGEDSIAPTSSSGGISASNSDAAFLRDLYPTMKQG